MAGVALGAVILLLLTAALRRIWGVDFWWQWATGRLVTESGIPQTDVFSYTVHGGPWIELRWLYGWTLYQLTAWAGYPAAVIAKAAMLLASFALVTVSVLRKEGRVVAGLVLVVAVLASSQRFFVRPELVTFLFVALYVAILHRYRRQGSRWLFLLPLLQVVWTNAHTLFILGPCLVGLLFVVTAGEGVLRRGPGEAPDGWRRQAVTVGAVLLATLAALFANPYGWEGVAFPFQLFSQIRGTAFNDSITEFKGPFDFEQAYWALTFYKLLIGLVVASALTNLRRLDPFWTILVLSQLYLSTLAIRNLPLFALAAIPFVIDNTQRSVLLARLPVRLRAGVGVAVSGVVVLLCGWHVWALTTDRYHVAQGDTNQFGVGLATSKYPVEAVAFMQATGIEGPVFHDMSEGSYLIAQGYLVYIDPRLEVYGEDRYVRYLTALSTPEHFRAEIEAYGVRTLLFGLQTRGFAYALADDAWALAYLDEVAGVFVPADEAPPRDEVVEAALLRVRATLLGLPAAAPGLFDRVPSPVPYERFALALLQLGHTDAALPFLRDAIAASPDPTVLRLNLATAQGALGDREAARATLEALVAELPENAEALYRLAVLHAEAGETGSARGLLDRSLRNDPARAEGWALRGRLSADLQDWAAAATSVRRAVELAPDDPKHRANLGRILLNAGRFEEALRLLNEARSLRPDDATLYRDLAVLSARMGEVEAARTYVEQGLALAPDEPGLLAVQQQLTALDD